MFRPAIIALAFAPSLLQAQNTGKITGKVTDAVTHRPVEGVHVGCSAGSRFVGSLTGVDGAYALEDVPPGPVRMTVNLDGYRPIFESPDQRARFDLAAGDAVTRDFAIHPLGRIYGKLVDHDTGDPIEGHAVSASRREYVPGHTFFAGRTAEGTGGDFDIRNLESGDYVIRIESADDPTAGLPHDSDAPHPPPKKYYGARWYPDVPRRDMATLIHLDEGETRNLEISLKSEETHMLSGTIETPPEFERQPVFFVLTSADGELRMGWIATPGSFRLPLTPGTYRIVFTAVTLADGKLPGEVSGDYRFEVTDHDIEDFKVVLALPEAGVSGEVRMAEEDAKLPGTLGIVLLPTSGWMTRLKNGASFDGIASIWSAPVRSGRFRRESVRPDEYWPQLVGLPAGYAVTQVLFEGSTTRYGTMNLSAPNTPLTFVVTSHPGAIAGVVRDEDQAPVGGAAVVLLPDPLPDKIGPNAIWSEDSGNDGAFVFKDLAPGNYRAVVLTGPDRADEGDMGYLRERAAKADPIEVRAGQSVSVNLKP